MKINFSSVLLACSMLFSGMTHAQSTLFEVLPKPYEVSSSSSPNGRAPFQRIAYVIPQTEITGNIPSGTSLTKLRLPFYLGANVATNATINVYLQNTTDATYTKGTTWATIVTGMTSVYNSTVTIPATGSNVDITFTTPFNYTGGGLYVAFDVAVTTPATSGASILANDLLASGVARGSAATAPTTLSTSSFRPCVAFGFANTYANDLKVDAIESAEKTSIVNGLYEIGAYVVNRSTSAKTNVVVSLNVSGANSHTDSKTITTIPAGGVAFVGFTGFRPTSQGNNNITVSLPADDLASNNSKSKTINSNCNTYSWTAGSTATKGAINPVSIGTALTTGTAEFVNAYPNANRTVKVAGVNVGISGDANNAGKTLNGAIYNKAGVLLAQSTAVTLTAADVNTTRYFAFSSPVTVTDTFHVGAIVPASTVFYAPIAMASMAYGIGYPGFIRNQFSSNAFVPAEYANNFGHMILEAVLAPNALTLNVSNVGTTVSTSVTGGTAPYSYNWSTGATTTQITASTGSFTVTTTDACGVTASKNIVISGVEGTNSSIVNIYPNPTTGNITLALNSGVEASQISVFNSMGQVVKATVEPTGNGTFELNLSNYNNGIYLIRVSQGANVATQTVLLAK